MAVEPDIYTRLSGYAGLTALVSTRIYPQDIPQDKDLPAVTYSKISDISEHAMQDDAAIRTIRMQIDCWAETYSESKSLETQVKGALSRYRSGNIKDCFFDGALDLYDGEEGIYHIPVDFIVFYSS